MTRSYIEQGFLFFQAPSELAPSKPARASSSRHFNRGLLPPEPLYTLARGAPVIPAPVRVAHSRRSFACLCSRRRIRLHTRSRGPVIPLRLAWLTAALVRLPLFKTKDQITLARGAPEIPAPARVASPAAPRSLASVQDE